MVAFSALALSGRRRVMWPMPFLIFRVMVLKSMCAPQNWPARLAGKKQLAQKVSVIEPCEGATLELTLRALRG